MIEVYIKGKLLKTPKGVPFKVANDALRKAIEEEWAKDGAENYTNKPLTSLIATAIDKVAQDRKSYILSLLDTMGTDTLLYWEPSPKELAGLQEEKWRPCIERINGDFGTNLKEELTLLPIDLELNDKAKFVEWLSGLSDLELTGFCYLHTLLGSFICTYLLFMDKIDADEACALAFLHQFYQQEIWGVDPEAEDAMKQTKAEIEATVRFLRLQ